MAGATDGDRLGLRDRLRDLMQASGRGGEDALKLADEMERCVFNGAVLGVRRRGGACSWRSPRFVHMYGSRGVRAQANLDEILRLVESEGWPVWRATEASPAQLRPDIWDSLQRNQRAKDERPVAELVPNTDTFKCKRCKSRKCYYYELQTRSGDEPMTVFVTCTSCMYKWRVGG
jgi:DNA-directed RNA polymerase subunit M/transcription elongation factor TFIIS